MPHEASDLLTTGEAAKLLGVAPTTVIAYAEDGKIWCWKLPSGHRRFRRAEIEALLPEPEAAK